MATTNFSAGTVIASTWLNDVDNAVYTIIPSLPTTIGWAGPASGKTFTVSNTMTLSGTDGAALVVGTGSVSGTNTGDQDLSGYAALAGAPVFTGIVSTKVQRSTVVALGNITGTVNVDLATGSTFTATVTGAVVISFTNSPPAGFDQTVYLKLTNGAAFATTFQAGSKFPAGTTPVLTAAGKDLLGVWYDVEQTAYVVGIIWKDYK